MSEENIEFENQPSVLDNLSVSTSEFVQYRQPLQVPRGTRFMIGYPTSEREYSRLLLKKTECFEIEVGFYRPHDKTVMGLPLAYPGYVERGTNPISER